MALTGIQVFKLTPKKNCRECGSPTCMAFSMKVAQGQATIDKCPYMSEQALEQFYESMGSSPIIDSSPISGATVAGVTYGNVSNASSLYFDDKILTPRGHGFAAEHANHLADLYQGKDARIVGDDNAKNGADRIVNGVNIQSKYCASGSKCVQECFDGGKFRYWNPDGSPMRIEVPADMYDSAVQAMQSRIDRGEVPGVTDAADIIQKGRFTYQQVKNIAKAGTVESICYDAASGAIIGGGAFGITAILTFATEMWNGEDLDVALKSAAAQGIKAGGVVFISSVLAGQLSKAGLNSALVGSSEAIVGLLGPKASAVLVNAFRSGTNIYGAAAMKSAAKMLRGNAITGIASFVILSVGDVGNIFAGRISGEQLFKNMANTVSGIAGGSAGWAAGATAGAAIGSAIPIVGTAVGGFVGGIIGAFGGGSLASGVSKAVLDEFIEDDAEKMVRIIQNVFTELAGEYLTTQKEAERIADQLKSRLTGGLLKDMYASDHRVFARNLLVDFFEKEVKNRDYVYLPSNDQMKNGIRMVLESISDIDAVVSAQETKTDGRRTEEIYCGCNRGSIEYKKKLIEQSDKFIRWMAPYKNHKNEYDRLLKELAWYINKLEGNKANDKTELNDFKRRYQTLCNKKTLSQNTAIKSAQSTKTDDKQIKEEYYGYNRGSKEYRRKLIEQSDKFIQWTDPYKNHKEEYDGLLKELVKYISTLEKDKTNNQVELNDFKQRYQTLCKKKLCS